MVLAQYAGIDIDMDQLLRVFDLQVSDEQPGAHGQNHVAFRDDPVCRSHQSVVGADGQGVVFWENSLGLWGGYHRGLNKLCQFQELL